MERFHADGVELISRMARSLVNHPDAVKVEAVQGENTTVFQLTVQAGDTGQVIGKQGKIADALRQILFAWSSKHRRRSVLEILE